MKIFKFKRLKIVEQIAIVFFFAVLIPMSVSGFIINNVNQQSMRSQLRESAVLITNMVSDEIDFFSETITGNLEQIAFSLKFFKNPVQRAKYIDEVKNSMANCENLAIVSPKEAEEIHEKNKLENKATITVNLDNNEILIATYSLVELQDELFNSLQDDKRQIYVLTNDGKLVASHNFKDEDFQKTISLLPKNMKENKPVIFGDVKNQPLVYVKKDNPKITIIVNTTEAVTDKAINKNRLKIILSTVAATLVILFVTALYTFYLYINIRQLFKGIIALSKGNYERQIRLLVTAFTPHEIVFLAFEFNRMASEIHKSYEQLQKNNVELKQLNEFRSNLIDTVSHELRTPLTSIQGYTSRLMRNDIIIDEETKQKSLRIIKEQSERLKRLIEDLLTIPDIEGTRLRTNIETVYMPEVFETAKILVKNKENKQIVINISEDFPNVSGDKTRLEQVFVNLIENAVKYAKPDSVITVDTAIVENKAKFFVKNECDVIPPKQLKKLFEKFVRLDDNTTRTTRGTGLGLFIVKGLVEAMNGTIELHSDEEIGFCAEVTLNFAAEAVDAKSN
ncbi:TPA: GHKL domain-containing protein [Candidatus Scatenecus faecavium]|uniref:histidine kinase n=1 Tax=Candidatus Scatenecus faecavium TaxID=2840915 RepID=A0A9D1FU72_9BACT|nr:GHKL domain-containing protein [Candidatus Scatenecus faecavium]